MAQEDAELKLQKIFGLNKFHSNQWKTIENILHGKRVLLIEKTGFGKSLCYQFPATQFKGLTVVFSPLIALMRDQIKKLNYIGVIAKCINSEQSQEENEQIIKDAVNGEIKILYIAPERQENFEWIEASRKINLSMVVIDEAHCISVWGHDFRPAFRRIINLVQLLPKDFPVLATTATATKRVEEDIIRQMGANTISIRGNLMRGNLHLRVIKVKSEDEKLCWLGMNLAEIPGNGIIYTGTRINTEIYTKWLNEAGVSARNYNAGLPAELRKDIEEGLLNNEWKCVVSTNALGMGIDKSDIKFIVHTQIPASPIHYYQEIGRAGRDGLDTLIILFYNSDDIELQEYFIKTSRPPLDNYYKVIDALQEEPLGEHQIMRATNLKQTQIRVIKADLIEQSIIREVQYEKLKKYEYQFGAPKLNMELFKEAKDCKTRDLSSIIDYVETDKCRMKFLCDFLGDKLDNNCGVCDNDINRHIIPEIPLEWSKKLRSFWDDYFPILELKTSKTNLEDGVAASYYGVSGVGKIIHKCKYKNGGDFPDFLLNLALKAFRKKFIPEQFDIVVPVPPTESGDLVKNFAKKISLKLNIPFSDKLIKQRINNPQKIFQNILLKKDNVKGAFIYSEYEEVKDKSILLIDDIFDSGTTVKELGNLFTALGAVRIIPLVIAKTVGGDIK